jgi:hypothetical protein
MVALAVLGGRRIRLLKVALMTLEKRKRSEFIQAEKAYALYRVYCSMALTCMTS